MIGTILVIILVSSWLVLCRGGRIAGAWGHAATGGVGLILLIVVILLLLGRI
jgi:hypothetical protein